MKIYLLLTLFIFQSCLVDDQRLISEDNQIYTDYVPQLSKNKIIENLERHNVIVAIIDQGVDHNHPRLKNNIHYSISSQNKVSGFGYDYTGEDNWPTPYLLHTAHLTQKSSKHQREEAQKRLEMKQSLKTQSFITSDFFEPRRDYSSEGDGINHGTHVANVASQNNPEIGIRSYRVLPFSYNWSGQKDQSDFEILLKALKRAVSEGVQIINMSLGITAEKGSRKYNKYIKYVPKLIQLIKNNPQVAFVIATGNDGQWVDGDIRLALPCSIEHLDNLVCVGAIDKDNKLAKFSNVIFNVKNLIYAPGVDIVAAVASLGCKKLSSINYDKDLSTISKNITDKLSDCENKVDKTDKMSGSSMATPFVSRKLAEIYLDNPNLNGAQMINILKSKAQKKTYMQFEYLYIK